MKSSCIREHTSALIVILGVAFEYFDLMLMNLLASTVSRHFIAAENPEMQTLYAYLVYAIAFLVRPFGALFFGRIGDRYSRKTALLGALLLMSLATLGIALIPSQQEWGILSTMLFFLCRIAQGLAVGGEYGAAMTYAFELNPNLRTFYGACVVSASHLGGTFAALLASLSESDFRPAFFVGAMIGCVLLLFRSQLQEGGLDQQSEFSLQKELSSEGFSSPQVMPVVKAIALASSIVFMFYGTLIYLNEWVHQELGIARAVIFRVNTALLLLWVLIPAGAAYLVDKLALNYRRLMHLGALGILASAPHLCLAMVLQNYTYLVGAQFLLHMFLMLFSLGSPRYFAELFPRGIRNTGVSISYSLGSALSSALTPLICHASITLLHSALGLLLPLSLAGIVSLLLTYKGRNHDKN